MKPRGHFDPRRARLLLASTSFVALIIGTGAPAWAACTQVTGTYTNSGSVTGLRVSDTSFSGSIENSGTISASGIKLSSATITGSIRSDGNLIGGISLDNKSRLNATNSGIEIFAPTFTGGLSNAGAISTGADALWGSSSTANSPAPPQSSPAPPLCAKYGEASDYLRQAAGAQS